MVDAVVHIGFGKTGTSSLQRYLSSYAANGLHGTELCYAAWCLDGSFIFGDELTRQAAASPHKYVVSADVLPSSLQGLAEGLARMKDAGRIPILSQENWSREGCLSFKYLINWAFRLM
jgi:hypothetical protein